MLQGNDCCVPLPWTPRPALLAYSRDGYARKAWKLPAGYTKASSLQLTNVTVDGLTSAGIGEVTDGELVLKLSPGQAVLVTE